MTILIWLLIVGLLLGLIIAGTAYNRTIKTIEKYNTKPSEIGLTALELVENCNKIYGLNCKYSLTDKKLGDAYIPTKKIVVLSKYVAGNSSVSALAIAGHEIGHAIQDSNNNFLLKLDMFFRVLYSIIKFFVLPIFVAGIILLFVDGMAEYGLIMFVSLIGVWLLNIIIRLITIPMEFGASKIAYNMLKDNHILTRAELKQAKQILNAAALTYIGALFINILNALRIIKKSFER